MGWGGIFQGVQSNIGQQNLLDLTLVKAKGSRVPAAHPQQKIPSAPPRGRESHIRSATKSYPVQCEHSHSFHVISSGLFLLTFMGCRKRGFRETNMTVHDGKIIFVILSYEKKNCEKAFLNHLKKNKTLKICNDVSKLTLLLT